MAWSPAMNVRIEPASVDDADALNVLINGAYRGDSSRAGWTTEADLLDGTRTDTVAIVELMRTPGTTLLKYVEDDKIVGCVELRLHKDKLYLGMLTVLPVLQGRGVGKQILNRAEAEAKSQGCTGVYMNVIADRKELIAWYERQGYRATGERKPFTFNDPRFGLPKKNLEFVILEKAV